MGEQYCNLRFIVILRDAYDSFLLIISVHVVTMVIKQSKAQAAHLLQGIKGEQCAQAYLEKAGLRLLNKNYRCRFGELDLVMLEGATLVIVEVRYRKSDRYGSAAESVTQQKQARLIAATHHYLAQARHDGPIRFDVVAISGNDELNWIKNAF